MEASAKIVIGAVVTGLISVAAHSMGSVGASFVDGLETESKKTLEESGIKGVNVAFEREPSIRRVAILSGDVSADNKDNALRAVKAVPGVADAYWQEDAGLAAEISDSPAEVSAATIEPSPEIKAIIIQCQAGIDEAMDGKTINFRSGSAYIPPSSYGLMDEIASILKPCKGVNLEIQGHTDLSGSAVTNQNISQSRADAVKAALVERGVDANIVIAKGYGETQPIDAVRSPEADAKNRRTVFFISYAPPS